MRMRTAWVMVTTALLSIAALPTAALAASAEDFSAAFSKAEAASKQAVAMKTGWSTTASELNEARKAAAAGRYDEAVDRARKAEAMANASIAQAKEQETAWTEAVIR